MTQYLKLQKQSRGNRYLEDYKSVSDDKLLKGEGYEVDYSRLIGVGARSAIFIGHPLTIPKPQLKEYGGPPAYTPNYDLACKILPKKYLQGKGALKARTRNLKLALALGQANQDDILRVIDVFKTADRIFIFMHYCIYGNCVDFIRRHGRLTEDFAKKWFRQVATALEFLHRFLVAHRNFKLENVLIDHQMNAKLTGFGLSKFCIDMNTKRLVLSTTICGSEPYLAPEMLKDSRERCYDPKQADVWAFGVGLFLSMTRRYPFDAISNLNALRKEQLAKRYLDKDKNSRLSPPVRHLINLCFEIDPNERSTMKDLCQLAWLTGPEPGLGLGLGSTVPSTLGVSEETSRCIGGKNNTVSSNIMQSSISRTSNISRIRK